MNLRKRFERFCFKHRDKGIPNLMLYLVIGSGIVMILSLLGYDQIYYALCFDRALILQGQVWRLITYVFTMQSSNMFFSLIMLYCYYSLGRAVESTWGTFKFNLYYLMGILLMDVFIMVFGGMDVTLSDGSVLPGTLVSQVCCSGNIMYYLHMSLLLCFATLFPDAQFLVLYMIPVKAWILALIDLIIIIVGMVQMMTPEMLFPHCLFPLVALANYFLFFGKDVVNILPPFLRPKQRSYRDRYASNLKTERKEKTKQAPSYSHRCVICGKTDVSNPELEFRYCSRCNGYFCYCQEHINNHTHVE